MLRSVKFLLTTGAGAIVAGAALVVGMAHYLGGDRAGAFQAAELGVISLASAQMGELPQNMLLKTSTDVLPKAEPEVAITKPAIIGAVDCTASFDAMLTEGAMVRLKANAPCAPDTRIQMRHEGLIFDLMTDADGRVAVDVPALARTAGFAAVIGDETLQTFAVIPDFDSYARAALQWVGRTGLQIHALEFGAGHDGDGHVWADAPGTSLRAVRARGGFITRLGDETLPDGHMAEVYIFPAGMIQRTGTVRLSVEAEVTAFSCGKAVEAQTFQPGADGKLQTTQLTLEIPGCDGIGDILVLKNLLRDMKIANN